MSLFRKKAENDKSVFESKLEDLRGRFLYIQYMKLDFFDFQSRKEHNWPSMIRTLKGLGRESRATSVFLRIVLQSRLWISIIFVVSSILLFVFNSHDYWC